MINYTSTNNTIHKASCDCTNDLSESGNMIHNESYMGIISHFYVNLGIFSLHPIKRKYFLCTWEPKKKENKQCSSYPSAIAVIYLNLDELLQGPANSHNIWGNVIYTGSTPDSLYEQNRQSVCSTFIFSLPSTFIVLCNFSFNLYH